MDSSSLCVAEFLGSLQDAMSSLSEVWSHFSKLRAQPTRPYLTLSSRPFRIHEASAIRQFDGCVALGLLVKGDNGARLELSVELLWDANEWTVLTEAARDTEAEGQVLLRQLPERSATCLDDCIAQLKAAISDLRSFDGLITKESQ